MDWRGIFSKVDSIGGCGPWYGIGQAVARWVTPERPQVRMLTVEVGRKKGDDTVEQGKLDPYYVSCSFRSPNSGVMIGSPDI